MRGIVPSLNTPFRADGAVDDDAVGLLVAQTLAAGCAGMLVNAVAGEQTSLTLNERDRIARIVVERTAGAVPVVVSVGGAGDSAATIELARMARAAGADGVCCQALAGAPADRQIAYCRAIADAGPDLLMIQDLDWRGGGLAVETIGRLLDVLPTFASLKIETVEPGPKYSEVLAMTDRRLHVCGGWAVSQMLDALARGVHAFMPTAMDSIYVAIHEAWRAGDVERAKSIFDALSPIIAFSNQHIDLSIRFFKMLRHREGVFATDVCRPPLAELDSRQKEEALVQVERALALQSELAAH